MQRHYIECVFVHKLLPPTTARCVFIRLSELDQPRVGGFIQGSTRQHWIPRRALSVASPTFQSQCHRAPQTIGYSHCQHDVLIMRVVICTLTPPSDVVITCCSVLNKIHFVIVQQKITDITEHYIYIGYRCVECLFTLLTSKVF